MPRPRVRLRTLLIAVAVVGVAIAAGREALRLGRLSRWHGQRAAEHAREEAAWRALAAPCEKEAAKRRADAQTYRRLQIPGDADESEEAFTTLMAAVRPDPREIYRERARRSERMAQLAEEAATPLTRKAEFHAELRRKHERAARHPWESVPPDPIAPWSDQAQVIKVLVEGPGSKDLLAPWPGPPLDLDLPLKTPPR